MMNLIDLLATIDVPCEDARNIQGISDDSRVIEKDWLFICRRGHMECGDHFVQEVLDKGAIILWEHPPQQDCYSCTSICEALPVLLNNYYQNPCHDMCIIGITGTNGKTSVSMILKQMLESLGEQTMVIGTGHVRYGNHDDMIENTTPSACILANYFALARRMKIPYIIMEVSSHAIDQERIGFIRFDFILYTNITKDHLDYHITRTHYAYTKFKLRAYLKQHGVIIVNHDYTYLHELYDLSDKKIVTFGITQAHLQVQHVRLHMEGSQFILFDQLYQTQMLGMNNVYNIIEALTLFHVLQIPIVKQQQAVKELCGIAGRLEVHRVNGYYVWIDYAHTDSAMKELLQLATQLAQHRVICLAGCGGERDQEKRPQMARWMLMYSDLAIFTSDNPRGEHIHDILFAMLKGNRGRYEIFENRAYAIKYAMKNASKHDIIILAGKGDEEYQLIFGKKYPFSDREIVRRYSKMEEEHL